jgi:hypothetical protein
MVRLKEKVVIFLGTQVVGELIILREHTLRLNRLLFAFFFNLMFKGGELELGSYKKTIVNLEVTCNVPQMMFGESPLPMRAK